VSTENFFGEEHTGKNIVFTRDEKDLRREAEIRESGVFIEFSAYLYALRFSALKNPQAGCPPALEAEEQHPPGGFISGQ
jgi:hypothetical protein